MKQRQKKPLTIGGMIQIVLTLVAVIWSLVPLYWMVSTAFMPHELDHQVPPVFIFMPTLKNFANLLETTSFTHYLTNTVIVSIFTTITALLFGGLAAYSFARFRYPGSDALPLFYLILRMLPRFVLVIPYYLLLRTFGLLNTYTGLILAFTTFSLPFVIWMMLGFFKEIPIELEEAGMVDGANRLIVLVRIVLPLALPGLAATSIFAFLLGWNELLFSIILAGRDTHTLAQMPLTFETDQGTDWGLVMAAGTLILLPVIIFALAVQRYILRGMTLGAVKG